MSALPFGDELVTDERWIEADLADRSAVERVLEGDRNAFAGIVDRHGCGLFRLAWRLLGDSAAAEEAAQEAFARAYSSLHCFRGECAFQPWLYRILVNLCRDIRKSGRQRESPCDDPTAGGMLPSLGGGNPPGADEGLERRRALIALEKAIQDLPDGQREALVMRLLENQSYEAISEVLKVPVGALKVRVHRARQRLRDELGPLLDGVLPKEAA